MRLFYAARKVFPAFPSDSRLKFTVLPAETASEGCYEKSSIRSVRIIRPVLFEAALKSLCSSAITGALKLDLTSDN